MDNPRSSVFTSWATFYGLIHKIVTKTEILALVWLVLGIYFRRYCPMIGYMAKWWIISKCHFVFIWLQSMLLSIKLWPKLKFWHWSPWCRVPVSISTAQFLVTCQIYGSFEGATLYLFCKNPRLGDNNCDQNWNFGTGLVAFKRLLWIILNYPWWHVNQIGWTNIQSNKIIFNLFN